MRGFPLINFLAVLVLLAGTAVPLVRISLRPALPPAPADPAATDGRQAEGLEPVTLLLRFAQTPESVTVRAKGEEVILRGSGTERQASAMLSLRGDLLELEIKAQWPEGVEQGFVELRAEPEGRAGLTQNLWSAGRDLEELAHFAWTKKS